MKKRNRIIVAAAFATVIALSLVCAFLKLTTLPPLKGHAWLQQARWQSIVRDATNQIPCLSQMKEIFPQTRYSGLGIVPFGNRASKTWSRRGGLVKVDEIKATAYFHDRYYLELTVPVETDFFVTRLKGHMKPTLFLAEFSRVFVVTNRNDNWMSRRQSTLWHTKYGLVKGEFTTNTLTFGVDDWNEVYRHGGDFKIIEFPLVTNAPVAVDNLPSNNKLNPTNEPAAGGSI